MPTSVSSAPSPSLKRSCVCLDLSEMPQETLILPLLSLCPLCVHFPFPHRWAAELVLWGRTGDIELA